jgi:hypothetical protein
LDTTYQQQPPNKLSEPHHLSTPSHVSQLPHDNKTCLLNYSASQLILKTMSVAQSVPFPGLIVRYFSIGPENFHAENVWLSNVFPHCILS